jgi:uncharacterized cupin superfamily protein
MRRSSSRRDPLREALLAGQDSAAHRRPETAHQIVNDSDQEPAYLSVSTKLPGEVCEYPDSGKVGAFGGGLRHMTNAGDGVDYWLGEK